MLDFIRNRVADDREFQILLEEEEGLFVATSPALPGFVAYGQSESSAVRKLRRAIRRNLEGIAEDYVRVVSDGPDRTTSRHKTYLHFRLPLTTPAKIVLSSVAAAAFLALVARELRRRR